MNEPQGSFLMDKDMAEIGRGTTPSLTVTLDGLELNTVDVLWLTLKQGSLEITKTLDDMEVNGNELSVWLSQEETLQFSTSSRVSIQVRALIGKEAVKSDIRTLEVSGILRDGIIE